VKSHIFDSLWRWAKRRHPTKSAKWVRRKYFRSKGNRNWVFHDKVKDKQGKTVFLDLIEISHTPIRRHVKFRAEANPFDPAYNEYIAERRERRKRKKLFRYCKSHWSPWWELASAAEES